MDARGVCLLHVVSIAPIEKRLQPEIETIFYAVAIFCRSVVATTLMSADKMHMAAKVPIDLVRRMDAFADREGRTRSWAIRELIDRSLRRLRMPADEGTRTGVMSASVHCGHGPDCDGHAGSTAVHRYYRNPDTRTARSPGADERMTCTATAMHTGSVCFGPANLGTAQIGGYVS